MKVLIAASLSFAILAYYASIVYERHLWAVQDRAIREERDRMGLKPPKIDFIPGQCDGIVGSFTTVNGQKISQGHKLEPPPGKAYYGFSLDFAKDNITQASARLGKTPAVFNAFTTINITWFDKSQLNWWASQAGGANSILELTVDPGDPIESLPDNIFEEFGAFLGPLTSQYGCPMLIRYGHEMNGNWRVNYGWKPTAYVRTFKLLADSVKRYSNITAMLWSPNIGSGYPYGAPASAFPSAGSADFLAMDTNNDGVIDVNDDPYGPFYPGDEYVDWVGLSLYQYSINAVTTIDYIKDNLNPSGSPLKDYYNRFSDAPGKPMAFSESGSAYTPALPEIGGNSEIVVKQTWWRSVMDASLAGGSNSPFPNLKLITNFEESKVEDFDDMSTGIHYHTLKDYQITFNPTILNAWLADVALRPAFQWANQLNYKCNGEVSN